MSWGPIVWLKNQLSTIIENNTEWKYSDYNKTGTRKYLFKTSDADYQPMGALDEYLFNARGVSDIDKNPVYIVGSFVPKVSGFHSISFAYQGSAAYPCNVAIGSLQDFCNACAINPSDDTVVQTPTDMGEAISAMFNKDFAIALMDYVGTIALSRLPHVRISAYTGKKANITCNLIKDVPAYYFVQNVGKGNATDFQIYNVDCTYYENKALY